MKLAFQNSEGFGQLIEKEPVGFTFDAPGWYFLITVICFSFISFWIFLQLKHRKNAYRTRAIIDLKTFSKKGFNHELIQEVNLIIKRIALVHDDKENVARLNGEQWILYLNGQCKKAVFLEDDHLLFEKAIYQKTKIDEADVKALLERSFCWIKEHKVKWI